MDENKNITAVPVETDPQKAIAARVRACAEEIAAALEKHSCNMSGIPAFVSDNRGGWTLTVRMEIQAK